MGVLKYKDFIVTPVDELKQLEAKAAASEAEVAAKVSFENQSDLD